MVAPHMGAWIEIYAEKAISFMEMSHPTWVRGLKFVLLKGYAVSMPSHPTWVRGLKWKYPRLFSTGRGRTPHGCVD